VRIDTESSAEPIAAGFDGLEDRLRAIRRDIGLGDVGLADVGWIARARATGRLPGVVAIATATDTRRAPIWDLLLLGVAWSGLVALVVQALQSA
jgi:hypothetical protein